MTSARQPTRVLLIDDERILQWALERSIDRPGSAVQVVGKAASVDEALRLLDGIAVDLILMEPVVEGGDAIAAIPELIARSGAAVLILTGARDQELHERAVLAGARGVVQKRDTPETLVKAIEKVAQGELWLDRMATTRVFLELSRKRAAPVEDSRKQRLAELTRREREIVGHIGAEPQTPAKLIAQRLRISDHTLRNHLSAIYQKLGVSSRLELFAFLTDSHLPKSSPEIA